MSSLGTIYRYPTPQSEGVRKIRAMFGRGNTLGVIGSYGQSKSLYSKGTTISAPPVQSAYSFAAGPKLRQGGSGLVALTAALASLASPYQEVLFASQQSWSPLYGFLRMWEQLAMEKYGLKLASLPQRVVGAVTGVSGVGIDTLLADEGPIHQNALSLAKYCIPMAQARGLALGHTRFAGEICSIWDHGENAYIENMDADEWGTKVEQIRDALTAQNLATLGTAREVLFVPGQLCTHLATAAGPRTVPSIALKIFAMEQSSGLEYTRVTPTYNLAYDDNFHHTAAGGAEYGARLGLQAWYRLVEGMDGVGIRAQTPTRDGTTITLPIRYLDGSKANALFQDSSIGTGIAAFGFTAVDTNGDAVTLSDATIVNNVRGQPAITFTDDGSATELRYAWTRASAVTSTDTKSHGQIRDNEPQRFVMPDGSVVTLNSYLPIGQWTIQ